MKASMVRSQPWLATTMADIPAPLLAILKTVEPGEGVSFSASGVRVRSQPAGISYYAKIGDQESIELYQGSIVLFKSNNLSTSSVMLR